MKGMRTFGNYDIFPSDIIMTNSTYFGHLIKKNKFAFKLIIFLLNLEFTNFVETLFLLF